MNKLLVGTNNPHKAEEIQAMLEGVDIQVTTPAELGIEKEPLEDGSTFEANAVLKATFFADLSGLYCLADDSGLMVDALDGRPGIFSARYAPTDLDRINRLLREMQDVPPARRSARFVCVTALVEPSAYQTPLTQAPSNIETVPITEKGVVEGMITEEAVGENGFGYDPVFYLPEYGKTMAQLLPGEKNAISHRARSLQAMKKHLLRIFQ